MKEAIIIFPHQLFKKHPAMEHAQKVYVVEDSLFFRDLKYPFDFHKKKLIFHRASLKKYEDYLLSEGFSLTYIDYLSLEKQDPNFGSMKHVFSRLNDNNIKKIHIMDPVDWELERRVDLFCKSYKLDKKIYKSPGFLCDRNYLREYFNKKKRYLQTSFYIEQRKRLNILLEGNKPKGGKWTYDAKNRKKIPKGLNLPDIPHREIDSNPFVKEAKKYVTELFFDNPGNIEHFFYPIDYDDAWSWFQVFLKHRLKQFGPYEDAMKQDAIILFHSLLSPLMNSGLIVPEEIIQETLRFSKENEIPLNSLEGFIRQIIGWREFLRGIYLLEGVKERTSNYWHHHYPVPESFYDGTTGVLPIDSAIKKLIENAYLHHIERLMLLGNFMTLCEIHPDEIYKWFMEMFIDAYDWVMVPNVYGMSTYADGGLITTKPYISSSNYVVKMSDYPKGNWCEIWDSLFWRFIHKYKESLKKNPRMKLMVSILKRKKKNDLNKLLKIAEKYLKNLHHLKD